MSIILKDAVVDRTIYNDGECIGNVTLYPITKSISDFVIYDQYRNKGYGQAVLKMLIDEGYNRLTVLSDNHAALHIYEKYGFAKTGESTIEMCLKNPRKVDDNDLE